MDEQNTEDFLDAPPVVPEYADTSPGSVPSPRRGPATWMSTGAWLLAGLVIGALVVAMLHTNSSSSSNTTGFTAGANQAPVGAQQPPNGLTGPPAGAFGGGFGGRLPGEQHVVGTLTAVGPSSITVNSTSGTATYPIESSTVLIKAGQRVSSPTALTVGDTVVVHVYPHNGSTHTEVVIDGVPAGGDPGGPDDNSTGTTTET